jgi:hypothetical protein
MIIHFEVDMVGPGFYLVVAIVDGEQIQVGLFSEPEEIDEACHRFTVEHRRLHLH